MVLTRYRWQSWILAELYQDGVGDHEVQCVCFDGHVRINTMCIKAMYGNVNAPLNTCTWVCNTTQYNGLERNGTQHNIQHNNVCTQHIIEHMYVNDPCHGCNATLANTLECAGTMQSIVMYYNVALHKTHQCNAYAHHWTRMLGCTIGSNVLSCIRIFYKICKAYITYTLVWFGFGYYKATSSWRSREFVFHNFWGPHPFDKASTSDGCAMHGR